MSNTFGSLLSGVNDAMAAIPVIKERGQRSRSQLGWPVTPELCWAASASIVACSGAATNTIKACLHRVETPWCWLLPSLYNANVPAYLRSTNHSTNLIFFPVFFFLVCDDHVMCESLKSCLWDLPPRWKYGDVVVDALASQQKVLCSS